MPRHSLGPDFVQLHYTTNGHQHTERWSYARAGEILIGEVPTALTKGGQEVDLDVALEAYAQLFGKLLPLGSSFGGWEAFSMASATAVPVFVIGGNIDATVFVQSNPVKPASQLTMSFRSSLGGRFHIQVMETAYELNTVASATDIAGDVNQGPFAAYIIGSSSIVRARDGGTLTSVIQAVTKTNDTLRRAYLV